MSTISDKDKIIENLNDKISELHTQLQNPFARVEVDFLQEIVKQYNTNEQTLYKKLAKRKAECDDVPDDNEEKSRLRNLTEEQKKLELAEKIVESVKIFYPRTSDENRAVLLLDMVKAGTIYDVHRVTAAKQTHVAFGQNRFKA